MKPILFFSLFVSLFISCGPQITPEIPSDEELNQKRSQLTYKQQKELTDELNRYSKLPINKIHRETKKYYKISKYEYSNSKNYRATSTNEYKRSYLPEEEDFDSHLMEFNFREKDSVFINYIKRGLQFGQFFEKDTNMLYILLEPDNIGSSGFRFSDSRQLFPYPSTHSTTYDDKYLKKAYYMNGTTEDNVPSKWCHFLNSTCNIGRKLPLDSLLVHYSISSICDFDSLVFTSEDLNKTTDDITVTAFEKNNFSYSFKSSEIVEIAGYDKDNKKLREKMSCLGVTSFKNGKEGFKLWLQNIEDFYYSVKQTDNKEDALKLVEDELISQMLDDSVFFEEELHFFVGNIDRVVLYRAKKRCTNDFDVMFRNVNPNQKYYTNERAENTAIIDEQGKTVLSVPISEARFAYSKEGYFDWGVQNVHYLDVVGEDDNYYVDYSTKKITKLENFPTVKALNENLVKAWDRSTYSYAIYDNNLNDVSDTVFSDLNLNGELIIGELPNREGYLILDKNGKRLLSYPVSYVAPNYNGLYRVELRDYFSSQIGFLNVKGEWVVPLKYSGIDETYDRRDPDLRGQLQIVANDGYGLIDLEKNGKLTVPCKYDYLQQIHNTNGTLYVATLNDKYGIISIDNKVVEPVIHTFEEIKEILGDK